MKKKILNNALKELLAHVKFSGKEYPHAEELVSSHFNLSDKEVRDLRRAYDETETSAGGGK